jgi:hypothetical protein
LLSADSSISDLTDRESVGSSPSPNNAMAPNRKRGPLFDKIASFRANKRIAIQAKETAMQKPEVVAKEEGKDGVNAHVDSLDDHPKRKLEDDIWDSSLAIKETEGLAEHEVLRLKDLRTLCRRHGDDALRRGTAWAALWKSGVRSIFSRLKRAKSSGPFRKPVDEKVDNAPGYYEVIKNPMDLGTIERHLDAKDETGYNSMEEFRDAVRLVFTNCTT